MSRQAVRVYTENQKMMLQIEERRKALMDQKEYKKMVQSKDESHEIFKNYIKYFGKAKTSQVLDDRAIYLFNFILANNMTNYILDRAQEHGIFKIEFQKMLSEAKKEQVRFSGVLDIYDWMGNMKHLKRK